MIQNKELNATCKYSEGFKIHPACVRMQLTANLWKNEANL